MYQSNTIEDKNKKRLKAFWESRTGRPFAEPIALNSQPAPSLAPLSPKPGLEPNTAPLTERQAYHLLRRTQFGAGHADVQAIVGQPADQVVNQIIDQAVNTPQPADPSWYNEYLTDAYDFEEYLQISNGWFFETAAGVFEHSARNGLGERMLLFWHNHFVTAYYESGQQGPFLIRYVQALRNHAFGNFKDFVSAVGLLHQMLYYLDGVSNEVGAPNENYARELLELFTMGILASDGTPNYSELDITEIARALTGYHIEYGDPTYTIRFEEPRFDNGTKTFFGRTGSWGYDDVIDILFEERGAQIAYYICEKLYRYFIYAEPQPQIVQELAQHFQNNNFELRPVLTRLLQSQHFYEEGAIGARIKSPAELFAGLLREVELDNPDGELHMEMVFSSLFNGQWIFQPPNVAGWPGHRTWISTASIPSRWGSTSYMLMRSGFYSDQAINQFVRTIHNADDGLAVFRLPVRLVEHMIAAEVQTLSIETIGAPWAGGLPIPDEIEQEPAYVHNLTKRMLSGIPWYEWDLNTDQAMYALRSFMTYITELPEYQLA